MLGWVEAREVSLVGPIAIFLPHLPIAPRALHSIQTAFSLKQSSVRPVNSNWARVCIAATMILKGGLRHH